MQNDEGYWEGEMGAFSSSKLSGQPCCPCHCKSRYCQDTQILGKKKKGQMLHLAAALPSCSPNSSFIVWLLALMSLKILSSIHRGFITPSLLRGTVGEKEEWSLAGLVSKIVLFCHVIISECLIVASKCLSEHQAWHCGLPQQGASLRDWGSPFLAHTPPQALLWLHYLLQRRNAGIICLFIMWKRKWCVKRGLSLEACVCTQACIFRVRDHDRVQ